MERARQLILEEGETKMSITDPQRLAPALVQKLEGAGYVLRKAVGNRRLAELVAAAGSLPEGVTRYLATSDGLDHSHSELDSICGSKEMLKPYPSNSLLPLKGDGCGNYEAVIIEPGPCFGAVVFWDHETAKAEYLVASSVPLYLELLVTFPTSDRWSSDGQSQDDFLRAHDHEAARLLDDPGFRTWVGDAGRTFTLEIEQAAPGEPLPKGARESINPFTNERVVFMPPPKYRTPPKQL